jgi:hypothetical protein
MAVAHTGDPSAVNEMTPKGMLWMVKGESPTDMKRFAAGDMVERMELNIRSAYFNIPCMLRLHSKYYHSEAMNRPRGVDALWVAQRCSAPDGGPEKEDGDPAEAAGAGWSL